jgi:hypothetical protein
MLSRVFLVLSIVGIGVNARAQLAQRVPPSERLLKGLGSIPPLNKERERPNCAGVALYNTGGLTRLEYVDPAYELPGILKKCYTLNAAGPSRGDIGVMFHKQNTNEAVHAWVEIGERDRVVTKNGEEAVAIQYDDRKKMLTHYRKEFEGKKVAYYSPIKDSKTGKRCELELQKYRLGTWKELEKSHR